MAGFWGGFAQGLADEQEKRNLIELQEEIYNRRELASKLWDVANDNTGKWTPEAKEQALQQYSIVRRTPHTKKLPKGIGLDSLIKVRGMQDRPAPTTGVTLPSIPKPTPPPGWDPTAIDKETKKPIGEAPEVGEVQLGPHYGGEVPQFGERPGMYTEEEQLQNAIRDKYAMEEALLPIELQKILARWGATRGATGLRGVGGGVRMNFAQLKAHAAAYPDAEELQAFVDHYQSMGIDDFSVRQLNNGMWQVVPYADIVVNRGPVIGPEGEVQPGVGKQHGFEVRSLQPPGGARMAPPAWAIPRQTTRATDVFAGGGTESRSTSIPLIPGVTPQPSAPAGPISQFSLPPNVRQQALGYAPTPAPMVTSSPDIDSLIQRYARAYGIDPNYLRAIAEQESSYDPFAMQESGKERSLGIFGMNQMGGAGEGFSDAQLFDPEFQMQEMVPKYAAAIKEAEARGYDPRQTLQHILETVQRPQKDLYTRYLEIFDRLKNTRTVPEAQAAADAAVKEPPQPMPGAPQLDLMGAFNTLPGIKDVKRFKADGTVDMEATARAQADAFANLDDATADNYIEQMFLMQKRNDPRLQKITAPNIERYLGKRIGRTPQESEGIARRVQDAVANIIVNPYNYADYQQDKPLFYALNGAMDMAGIPKPSLLGLKDTTAKSNGHYATLTLLAARQLMDLVIGSYWNHPYIGPLIGRGGKIDQLIGKPFFAEDPMAQEIRTRMVYLLALESRVVIGARPPVQFMEKIEGVTPQPHMNAALFLGALAGSIAHAKNAYTDWNKSIYGMGVNPPKWDTDMLLPGQPKPGSWRFAPKGGSREFTQYQAWKWAAGELPSEVQQFVVTREGKMGWIYPDRVRDFPKNPEAIGGEVRQVVFDPNMKKR